MLGLGFDGGGSGCRWVLHDFDGPVASGELSPIIGHLSRDVDRENFGRIVGALREAARSSGRVGAIVAGITGLSGGSDTGRIASGVLAETFGLDGALVRVEDDARIAFAGAFAPGAGHLVYAGTGSVGLHVRADGSSVRVGGLGMLLDDGGSAFAIGRAGLALVLRALDEDFSPRRSALADALFSAMGGRDWNFVRAHVYGAVNPRDAIAQLARAVAVAADAGDATALEILWTAGDELGRLAAILAAREGFLPVALVGRAAGLHPAILAAARARAVGLEIMRQEVDAAAAAARMAFALVCGVSPA